MPASDALRPEQLKLFMTAPEIKERVTHSMDQAGAESMPKLWERKWQQSDRVYDRYEDEDEEGKFKGIGPSLRGSIIKHGYEEREPIPVVHSEQGVSLPDAHHRVEVMSRLHPDQFLNVQHHAARFDLSTTGDWVRDYHEAAQKRRVKGWPEGQM